MLKLSKGSLTVEAALALPIFMATMLFISSTMKAYYIQDAIQDALTEAVKDTSSICYAYYVTGVPESHSKINKIESERSTSLNGDLERAGEVLEKVQGNSLDKNAKSVLQSISPEKLQSVLAKIPLGKTGKTSEDVITEELLRAELGFALSSEDKNLLDKLKSFKIKGGMEGLDFNGSEYFVDGDTFDVQVKYTVKSIDPFGIIKNVSMKNRVVCKAWMGGVHVKGDGLYEHILAPGSMIAKAKDNTKDAKEVMRTCYIIIDSKTSKRYHFQDCSSLREKNDKEKLKTLTSVPVPFVSQNGQWEPKGSSIEYSGVQYSCCKNCLKGAFRIESE